MNKSNIFQHPTTCRACDAELDSAQTVVLDGFLSDTRFSCGKCPQCGTLQTGMGDDNALIRTYNTIYRHSSVVSGYKRYNLYGSLSSKKILTPFFDILYAERIYNGALTFLNDQARRTGRKLKILEIGSGLGYTTARLRRLGHNVVGCDLSADACARASELHGGEFICGTIERVKALHGETFDLVLCLEVIEHVDKPLQLLLDFRSVINRTGSIIITTPNLMDKEVWDTTEPPIHATYFTLKGILSLAERSNGSCDVITYSRVGYKVKTGTPQHLPGSVLLENYEPNPAYFDYGPISAKETTKFIIRNCLNRLYYSFAAPNIIFKAVDIKEPLNTTSIIVSIRY